MSRYFRPIFLFLLALWACGVSPARAARFPANIDLGNPFNARTLRILGALPEISSGSALAGGDFNGDGFLDLVIGAPTGNSGKGITYVVMGKTNFTEADSLDLSTASGVVKVLGKNALDWSGYTVATGNLNGDAYTDIIIGAYRADPGGRINAGEVYVIFGSSSFASRGTIDLSGSPSGILRIQGNNPEDGLGFSLAAGRVNGDACDDLILGAYHASPGGRVKAGQAVVIYGSTNLSGRGVIDLSASYLSGLTVIHGEAAECAMGTAVAAGDLNGDAFADVIIGGTGALGGKGSICVVPGSAAISTRAAIDLSSPDEQLVKIYGVSAGDGWGSMVRVGNLNGDGYADLIFSAPSRDAQYRTKSGEVAVFFGEAAFWDRGTVYLGPDPTDNTLRVWGAEVEERAGTTISAGDANHDGRDDLIIGAPFASPRGRGEAGSVYILNGAANLHLKRSVDLADTAQVISRLDGALAGVHLGSSVASMDLDGDNCKDVLIGSPLADPAGRTDGGETYAVFGFNAPAILSYRPNGTKVVNPESDIALCFNSDMSRVNMQVFDGIAAGEEDSLTTSGSSVVYHPAQPFTLGSQIRVRVNGTDRDAQSIPQKIWYFDIKENEIPPRFLSMKPVKDERLVSPTQNIIVKFNADIKPDSTRVTIKGADKRTISMTKSWSDSVLTLVNNNSFRLNETITITVSAADQYGDRADSTWSFITRSEIKPPTPTVQVPGIPQLLSKSSWFRLFFPYDVNKDSVDATLSGSMSGDIAGTWAWADSTYTFTPAKDLYPGETLQLTVNAEDLQKNIITGWTAVFTVKPDEIPPSIKEFSPGASEQNVSPSAPIIITFSPDVDRDSTVVKVTSKANGVMSLSKSWLDYTLSLGRGPFPLSDSLTVQVNAGDRYANRSMYSWGFTVRPETTPPSFTMTSPVRRTLLAVADSISLVFPADVDTSTVTVSLKGRLNEDMPGVWRWTETCYTFTPSVPYPAGYIITMTVNAEDIHRNAIPETVVTFTVKPDAVPPAVRSHTPPAYASDTALNSVITVNFTSDVAPDSTKITLRSDKRGSIGYSRSWTDSTLTITPSGQFQSNETVTVTLSAADKYANRAEYSWTFSTGSWAPPYTPSLPTPPSLLFPTTPVSVTIGQRAVKSTVTAALTGSLSGAVKGSWTWTDSLYTFTPSTGYRLGETLTLRIQARDAYGNAIPEYIRTFQVRADLTPPVILSRTPAPEAINQLPAVNLAIAFSGDVAKDSTTVQVRGSQNRTIAVTSSWQDSTLTLAPGEAFRLGEVVTVMVRAGDRYSNRAEYTWSFTVRPEIDPPAFQVRTPHDPQLLLAADPITLQFPGDVEPSTVRATLTGSLSGAVAGGWAWSDLLYTFTPLQYRPGETLTLIVNAADIHGNAIPETRVTLSVKPDEVAPVIRAHTPTAFASDVPVSSGLVIRFSSDVAPDSTTITLRSNKRSSIGFTRSWTDSTLTITPASQFQLNETVTVTLSAADRYANRMIYSWTFSTGSWTPPYTPGVATDPTLLLPATPISVTIGQRAVKSTVSAALTGSLSGAVTGNWAWADSVYTFTPSSGYRLGETLTLRIQAKDAYGNSIPEFTRMFQVRPDLIAPAILSRTPVPDAVNQLPAQNLAILFSGDVEKDSTAVQVRGAQDRVITVVSSWRDSTLTLTPGAPFRLGEVVTVTVNTGDRYSNRAEYTWIFTIRPEIDPPAFQVRTPHDPQILLAGDPITLQFPGDVDPSAVQAVLTGSLSGTVAGNWAWSDSLYTFTPQAYRPGEILTLIVNAVDRHGNAIPETIRKLRVRGDSEPPVVLVHSPQSGEVNVSPSENIAITFSGDVEPDSTTVLVRSGKGAVITCIPSWRDSTLTLGHSELFSLGETVAVTVKAGDLDTNRAEYSWSFSVRAETTLPTAQVEASGDITALAANAPLTLTFPADVDTARVSALLAGSLSGSISGAWSWDGFRYTFTPGGLYRPGETLTLRVTAVDINGNVTPETTYTFIVGEHTPRLSISSVGFADSTKQAYRVGYSFEDPDNNLTVTRSWQYSLDNGPWVTIPESDISDNPSRAPGSYRLLWKVPSAFNGVYSENIRFRMEVFDGRYRSGYRESPKFGVDRNQPPSVAIHSAAPDYTRGKVQVAYAISDTESNPVALGFEYSLDGGISWKSGTPDRDLENNTSAAYTGSFGWAWSEGLREGTDYFGVLVRLIPRDYKSGVPGISQPFRVDLNAPPSVTLDDLYSSQSGDVALSYHITDAESDTVRFVCSYSTNGGSTWIPTINVSGADSLTLSQGTLVWHSGLDLPAIQSWNVRFQAIPYDHDAGTGGETGTFQLLNNAPPAISAAFPDTSGYRIRIPVTITDIEGDAVTLHVSWSNDGGISWKPATLLSDTLNLPSNAGPDTLAWMARTDLGEGFFESVRLRITAGDDHTSPDSTGAGYALGMLTVDNLPPHLVSVSGTAERDTISVRFDEIMDEQSAITPGNYSLSGGLRISRVKEGTSGDRYFLILEEGQTLSSGEVSLRATNLRDRFGNPALNLKAAFTPDDGNANPTVSIGDLPPAVTGDVTVPFHIQDGEGDAVSLAVSFSTDGGSAWRPATVSGSITALGPAAYDGTFIWRSATDIPGMNAPRVMVRVVPLDSQEGEPSISGLFQVLNNNPPSVQLRVANPDSIYSGTVDIAFTLLDAERDTLALSLSYSTDDGRTFLPASASGTLSGLAPDRYAGSLHWDTAADLPGFFGRILLRAEPRDAASGPADTLAVIIDNYGACRVAVTAPAGECAGDITVHFTITDPHSRPVSLRANYSPDGGTTWKPATLDGQLDALGTDRYTGTFTWKSAADLAGFEGGALLEVIPNNGRDGASGRAPVTVDYNAPPSAVLEPFQNEVSGDVAVQYTAADPERDRVSLILRYSIDNRRTWYAAETSGEVSGIVADGEPRTVVWRSASDLPGRDTEQVWIRLAVADADTGAFSETGPIHLDNNLPPAVLLSVDAPSPVSTETLELKYVLSDSERNMLHLEILYSIDGGASYQPASITGKTSSIFSSGYSGGVQWNLAADLPDRIGEAVLKCIPWDTEPGTPDSLTIRFNTLGECRVALEASGEVQDSDIAVSYTIFDQKNRTVTLHPEYSVTGLEWKPATVTGKTDDLTPGEYSGTLVWKGKADLAGASGTVYLRVTPDIGAEGTPDTVRVAVDYNEPPSIIAVLSDTTKVYSGNLEISLTAGDPEGDSFTIGVEYSLDNGATFQPATVTGNSGLSAANPGNIVWNTFPDLGYAVERLAILRLSPADRKNGAAFLTGPFRITNLVGDFTYDQRVDGSDLTGFIQTWKYQALSREMGPVNGTPPTLTVLPDGKVDFEDLAGFVWMWNWFSAQVTAKGIAASLPETPDETGESGIRFTPDGSGGVEVTGDTPLDYLRILVEPGGEARIGFEAGEWWTGESRGVSLTRAYPGRVFEVAAALLEEHAAPDGPVRLGTLRVEGSSGDVCIRYSWRSVGGGMILSGTAVIPASVLAPRPTAFLLYQNSPNPFNPSTLIRFALPRETMVNLTVYNLTGQKIAVLREGKLSAGYHTVRWEAAGFPSGVYFYTLSADGFRSTRRMTLVK